MTGELRPKASTPLESAKAVRNGNCAEKTRIKSLDGIRAIAICLVLVAHALNHKGVFVTFIHGTVFDSVLRKAGHFGVIIFFALSGYLITTLLTKELERSGRISLTKFWYRRILRIFPIFYFYIAVIAVLTLCGLLDLKANAFAVAATQTWNYQYLLIDYNNIGADSFVLAHFWSLAVEEQFYLFFPILFVFFRPSGVFAICCTLVLVTPVIRVSQYLLFPDVRVFVMGHNMIGASIAIGSTWALAEFLDIATRTRAILTTKVAFTLAFVVGFLVGPLLNQFLGIKWVVPFGESVAAIAAMVMISHCIRFADTSHLGTFLNLRPVVWLGVISYSLYIWQQLFFHMDIPDLPMSVARPLLALAGLMAATLSYYLLELPILRNRERIWQFFARLPLTSRQPLRSAETFD